MKNPISVAVIGLSILSLTSATRADELPSGLQVTHLDQSGARPDRAYVLSATHYFKVYVAGKPLSKLSVVLPKKINVKDDVAVTDQSGQKLDTSFSVKDRKVSINFAQPVSAGTNLLVSFKNVKTPFPRRPRILLYPVYSKSVGMAAEIPLGLARVSLRRF